MILEENRFENVLKSLRVRRGWTQEDAVAHIGKGMSRHTYIDVEIGNLPPSPKHLRLIATGFKLSPDDTDMLYRAAHHTAPKMHNLPFRRNPLFTGREDQFKQLNQCLLENGRAALAQIAIITGLGGIGKTQLALEYAYRHHPDVYQAVFWMNAADEASLQTGYATLAEKLDLPEKDGQKIETIVQAVKDWLADHTNWLLIMDNADNLPLARSFFPKADHGHILLTTRSQMVGDVAGEIIELDNMKSEEGLLFLLLRSLPPLRSQLLENKTKLDTVPADIRNAASQVVALLDGHPLALDHAGAYIEDTGKSFSKYIQLYREERRRLLNRRSSQEDETKGKYSYHRETVAVTFRLCFRQARKRQPLATNILRFCAFLHPDAIPEELFEHDESFKYDADALSKGITALLRYSLLKPNVQAQTYSMHRLVQGVVIDAMAPNLQRQWRERVVHALYAAFPKVSFKEWRWCERLLPHALVCATWKEDSLTPIEVAMLSLDKSVPTLDLADLFHIAGIYLHDRGRYSEAEPLLIRAHSIMSEALGAEHTDTIKCLQNLAGLYVIQGKYERAATLRQQALANYENTLKIAYRGYPSARSLFNLGILYKDNGKFEQAEPLLIRAHSIMSEALGAEHPDTIKCLQYLADLYVIQGKYEQAIDFYQQVIATQKKQLGAEHPNIARSLQDLAFHGLARLKQDQEQYEQAEALYQRALSIRKQLLGSKHHLTQDTIKDYAEFLQSMGRDAEAEALEANDGLPE